MKKKLTKKQMNNLFRESSFWFQNDKNPAVFYLLFDNYLVFPKAKKVNTKTQKCYPLPKEYEKLRKKFL